MNKTFLIIFENIPEFFQGMDLFYQEVCTQAGQHFYNMQMSS